VTLVAVSVIVALFAIPTAASAYPTYHVAGTEGHGLHERTGPGYDNYPEVGFLTENTSVEIVCQTWGELVTPTHGSPSRIWDKLPSGHYVSDDYISTPDVNEFTPGIGVCPPTAAIFSPGTGQTYFEGEHVPTSFECQQAKDAGIASCTDSNGGSGAAGTLDTSSLGAHNYRVTATGGDGATATAEISYVVAALPSATISQPATGETYAQGATVTTTFACADGEYGPGLESCTDSNGASGGSGTLDTSTTGPHTYIVTAKSKDGGATTKEIAYTVVAIKTTCSHNAGKATYSPGLTDTPTVQTVKLKGSLSGCSGAAYTSATYTAVLRTTGPIACSALTSSPGEPANGTLNVKWRPKGKASNSTGAINIDVTSVPNAPIGGTLSTGPFSPSTLSGSMSETFAGAETCGVTKKGKVKPVKKATFTGSSLTLY
jgi:hypothetical protein